MPDAKAIYQSAAERYHALVMHEDFQSNLLPAIQAIDSLNGKTVIELGAGTGRISCLVVPLVCRLVATDVSHHMLSFGRQWLAECAANNWHMSLSSHLALPFANCSANAVISGWSFCYAAIDAGETWQGALAQALSEVQRVLQPSGKFILIESLGSGDETPHPPEVLVNYLDYLDTHGFESTWIRTDYRFRDKEQALSLTSFFFGDDPLPMWETEDGVIVPECTGLWWTSF